jgi:hypothetical protein
MINRNALRLKKLADDILQVSKIEGGVYKNYSFLRMIIFAL